MIHPVYSVACCWVFCLAQLVQIGSHDTASNELTLNDAEVKKMWKGIYNEIASSAGISMDLACEWEEFLADHSQAKTHRDAWSGGYKDEERFITQFKRIGVT